MDFDSVSLVTRYILRLRILNLGNNIEKYNRIYIDMAPPSAIEVTAESDTTGITIPNPLTIQGVQKRRAASGRLVAGVAAVADVETFKGLKQHSHKPSARRWDRELSQHTLNLCFDG